MYNKRPFIYIAKKKNKSGGSGGGGTYPENAWVLIKATQAVAGWLYMITGYYYKSTQSPSFKEILLGRSTLVFEANRNSSNYKFDYMACLRPSYHSNSNTLKKVADAFRWEYAIQASPSYTWGYIRWCFYYHPDNPIIYRLEDTSIADSMQPGPDYSLDSTNVNLFCLTNTSTIEKIEDALHYYNIPILTSYASDGNGVLMCLTSYMSDEFIKNYIFNIYGHGASTHTIEDFSVVTLDINIPQQT